jgi:hypothetical protein
VRYSGADWRFVIMGKKKDEAPLQGQVLGSTLPEEDVKSPGGTEQPVQLPSLVEAVGTWDVLRREIVERQTELRELLEGAETLRQFLLSSYGVAVASLGQTTAAPAESTTPGPAESTTPGPAGGETYTPPLQGPIYDPVQTGPMTEAQVDGIRKDAAIPGGDSASFGAGIQGVLDSVRRTFAGR